MSSEAASSTALSAGEKQNSKEVDTLLHSEENTEKIQASLANITKGLGSAADMYGESSTWMHEWIDSIGGDKMGPPKVGANGEVQYDLAIFGPQLKGTSSDDLANEINKLLLSRESDFTDALVNIDADNFLADPYECFQRNTTIGKQLIANTYSHVRDVFLSLPLEMAMQRMHAYRQLIRTYRSSLYVSGSSMEQMDVMSMKIEQLEGLKEKYEATIYTLRRQLQDFHGNNNTVGRMDGGFGAVPTAAAGAAGSAAGLPGPGGAVAGGAAARHPYVIIVQVEDLGPYRSRHRQLCEQGMWVIRDCAVNLAKAFELRRTNYLEAKEDPDLNAGRKIGPPCYMFTCDEVYNAVAYAAELHLELSRSDDWPKALLDMNKFSTAPWRGIRVRVGIHSGPLSAMELAEPSRVSHFEGVAVEKTMRLTGLGLAGDTVISQVAWDEYLTEKNGGGIPASKRYVALSALVTGDVTCAKKPGFKKGEVAHRVWHKELQERKDDALDCDFGQVAFWKLEASNRDLEEEDDAGPTTEDLLAAKETEVTLMQQELDSLQMAVMKRDSDLEETQGRMFYAISTLQRTQKVKTVYLENLVRLLECQSMEANDAYLTESREASLSLTEFPLLTPQGQSIKDSEKRRARLFEDMGFADTVDSEEEGETSVNPASSMNQEAGKSGRKEGSPGVGRAPSKKKSGKHKNQKLWRELKTMVGGNGKKVVEKRSLQRRSSMQPLGSLSGTAMLMNRFHSTFRVFSALLKRYVTDGSESDQDNQSITEDQFIQLFMSKVHVDSSGAMQAGAREAMSLMASAAIEDPDIEEANSKDSGRLVRSCGGHLAKILKSVSKLRNKALLMMNQAETTEKHLHEELEKLNSAKKKGGKKGAKGEGAAKEDGNTLEVPASHKGGPSSKTTKSGSLVPGSHNAPDGRIRREDSVGGGAAVDKMQKENDKLQREVERLKNELTKGAKRGSSGGRRSSALPELHRGSLRRASQVLQSPSFAAGPSGGDQATNSPPFASLGVPIGEPAVTFTPSTDWAADTSTPNKERPTVAGNDSSSLPLGHVPQSESGEHQSDAPPSDAPVIDLNATAAFSSGSNQSPGELGNTAGGDNLPGGSTSHDTTNSGATGPTGHGAASHDTAHGVHEGPGSQSANLHPASQAPNSLSVPGVPPRGTSPTASPATGSPLLAQPRSLLPPTQSPRPEHDLVTAQGFDGMEDRTKTLKEKWAHDRAERQQQQEARVRQVREEKEKKVEARKLLLAARASASREKKPMMAGIMYDDGSKSQRFNTQKPPSPGESSGMLTKPPSVVNLGGNNRSLSAEPSDATKTGTGIDIRPSSQQQLRRVTTPSSQQQQQQRAQAQLDEPLHYAGNTFQVQTRKQTQEQQSQEARLKEQLRQLKQMQEMQLQTTGVPNRPTGGGGPHGHQVHMHSHATVGTSSIGGLGGGIGASPFMVTRPVSQQQLQRGGAGSAAGGAISAIVRAAATRNQR